VSGPDRIVVDGRPLAYEAGDSIAVAQSDVTRPPLMVRRNTTVDGVMAD
jgi:hypothetical protein